MFQNERNTVVETCRVLADRGYLAGTGGNVAIRADTEHLVVTPSATDYYTMLPEDVCVVRLSDLTLIDGSHKPSVETGLHAKVLGRRGDCTVSIHTHQPIASAYTLLARPLHVQVARHSELLGATIPCAGYAPSGTGWLAARVARNVTPHVHAYLMRNHGAVCVGADVSVAVQRVTALEEACSCFFEQQVQSREQLLPQALVQTVRSVLAQSFSTEPMEKARVVQ